MKILYNNRLENELEITPLSRGFQFGDGFFTTIKVVDGIGDNLDLHLKRVEESFYYFDYQCELPNLEESITRVLKANSLKNCRIKAIYFRDLEGVSSLYIPGELPKEVESATLNFSKYYRGNNPIFKYKSLNYYPNLQDAYRVILNSDGNVLETGIGNIFIIEGNKIITPPKDLPLLPGTYRERIVNLKSIGDFTISEEIISKERLIEADEIFFTNSLRGIVGVNKLEDKNYSISKILEIKNLIP